MTERRIPKITFEQIQSAAVKPQDVSSDRWSSGLAVVKNLMKIGQPIRVPERSPVGRNVPDAYYVTGTGVTVEHTLGTDFAVVTGEKQTIVTLPDADLQDNETNVHPAVTSLNEVIVNSWR